MVIKQLWIDKYSTHTHTHMKQETYGERIFVSYGSVKDVVCNIY